MTAPLDAAGDLLARLLADPAALTARQHEADRLITSSGAAGRLLGLATQTPDVVEVLEDLLTCLLYTSPSPRDRTRSRMPSSA